MRRVAFRVDASVTIGSGHLMRCLPLAERLRARGAHVRFVCRDHDGNMASHLWERAFPTTLLPVSPTAPVPSDASYETWLGAPSDVDASETIEALGGERTDWLIVDHYGAGLDWERKMRPHVGGLLAIDDLARSHACDVLLDQNYSNRGDARYDGLVPDSCRLLTGPRYALLASVYADQLRVLRPREIAARRILVSFGGTDPRNATGLALEALSRDALRHLAVDVVVGPNNPHRKALERQAEARPGTTILGPQPHLAGLMAEADLAIGAGGFTSWERLCLGLPTVIVSIAENQEPACAALAEARLAYYAGDCGDVTADSLAAIVERVVNDPRERESLAARGQEHCDGLGTGRVAEVLFPSRVEDLRMAPAAGSRGAGPLVMEAAGLPVGWMRFERDDEEIGIDWMLDPVVDGRTWEEPLVRLGIGALRDASPGAAPFFYGLSQGTEASATFSIAILSDASSWINDHVPALLLHWLAGGHRVCWVHERSQLREGDFCFLLGCGQLVPPSQLAQYRNSLVVHESDLPRGKGWSPLTWQILEGESRIPVTLLEAVERVDSGAIYAQEWAEFEGDELIDEMRAEIGRLTRDLCMRFVETYPRSVEQAREQRGRESFYERRRPQDSRLDVSQSLESQFELLRVVDAERYPGFFEHRGHRYRLSIEKEDES